MGEYCYPFLWTISSCCVRTQRERTAKVNSMVFDMPKVAGFQHLLLTFTDLAAPLPTTGYIGP